MTAFKTIIPSGYQAKKTAINGSFTPFITIVRVVAIIPSGQMSGVCSISIVGTAALRSTAYINALSNISISAGAKLLGTSFIAPSSSISIAGGASMTGIVLVVANSTASLTCSATLVGISPGSGIMTGNAAIYVVGNAALIGTGLMIVNAAMSITATAGLTNTGYMTATATISMSGLGSVIGAGLMTAVSAVQITVSANIIGIGLMVGSAGMSITGDSVIIKAIGIIAGDSSASIVGSGLLKAIGLMAGNTAASITGSVSLKAVGKMAGTATASITGSATVIDGGASYDADAQSLFTAASITDTAQKDKTNAFILRAKAGGWWSKIYAGYLWKTGSSNTQHSYNFKDVGLHQISWGGTTAPSHSANGVDFTGAGYGDTGINPNTHLQQNSAGATHNTSSSGQNLDGAVFGCEEAVTSYSFAYLDSKDSSGTFQVTLNTYNHFQGGQPGNNIQGTHSINRKSSSEENLYREGSLHASATSGVGSLGKPNRSVYVGASNAFYGTVYFSNEEVTLLFIKNEYFSSTEEADVADAVSDYVA